MKKNITIICVSLVLVYLLFTHNVLIGNSILNSCQLFLSKVFISLFPMYIISKILINYNFPYYLFKITKSHYLYIFIMSLLSGTPNNAVIIKDLLDRKVISEGTANTYIMCNFFIPNKLKKDTYIFIVNQHLLKFINIIGNIIHTF